MKVSLLLWGMLISGLGFALPCRAEQPQTAQSAAQKAQQDKTPLMLAAGKEDLALVKTLLDQGADVNAKDAEGNTALHDAVSVQGLHKFDANGAESYDRTWGQKLPVVAVVEALLAKGADVNAQNARKQTPLSKSLSWNYRLDVVKVLVQHKADLHLKGENGNPILSDAVSRRDDPKLVELLVEHGAEVNARNVFNETPLFDASNFQYLAAIAALLQAGANVNAADDAGNTPLISAVTHYNEYNKERSVATVKLLLKHGANVNAKNREQETALQLAQKKNRNDLLPLLKQAGAKD